MADEEAEVETARPNGVQRANGSATRRRAAKAKADDLESQIAQLESDIRSISHTLGRMGELSVDEVKSRASAQANYVRHRGQRAIETVSDEFTDFERHIKDTIRDKPLTAVAGALAMGFVLAVLTR